MNTTLISSKLTLLGLVLLFLFSCTDSNEDDLLSKYEEAYTQYKNQEYRSSIEGLKVLLKDKSLDSHHDLRGRILFRQGANYLKISILDSALIYFYRSQKSYEFAGNTEKIVKVKTWVGALFMENGALDLALDYFTSALVLTKQLSGHELRASLTYNVGYCLSSMEKYDEAYPYFQDVEKMGRDMGGIDSSGVTPKFVYDNPLYVADLFLEKGVCQLKLGHMQSASEEFKQALEIGEDYDLKEIRGVSYNRLGEIAMKESDVERAKKYLDLAISETDPNSTEITLVHVNKGNLSLLTKQYVEAVKHYDLALQGDLSSIDSDDAYVACDSLISYFTRIGDEEGALNYYEKKFLIASIVSEQKDRLMVQDSMKDQLEFVNTSEIKATLRAEESEQRTIIEMMIGGLFLVLIIAMAIPAYKYLKLTTVSSTPSCVLPDSIDVNELVKETEKEKV